MSVRCGQLSIRIPTCHKSFQVSVHSHRQGRGLSLEFSDPKSSRRKGKRRADDEQLNRDANTEPSDVKSVKASAAIDDLKDKYRMKGLPVSPSE